MARKKATPEPPSAEGVAEQEVKTLELVPEFRPTKRSRNIEQVQKKVLNEHLEPLLNEAVQVLRIKLRAGDKECIRLALELGKLVGAKAGVSVTTNVQQNNANEARAAVALSARGFDELVRRLDGREYQVSTNSDFVADA